MISLYKNNYIEISGSGPTFKVDHNPLPTKFENYYIESRKAAEEIYELRNGKLNILYSGGIDSEFALSIFLDMGIPITPVIIKLNPDYNIHDLEYATKFCQDKNIEPVIIDIDFDWFVESGLLLSIAKETNCNIYHRSATAYAAKQLDGTVLLGDGEPYVKLQKDGSWNIEINQHEYAVSNYFQLHNIHGTAHFNTYTPEMKAAFLSDARIYDLVHNRLPGKQGTITSKPIIYNRNNNFNLSERPKYHGYECIPTSEIFQHPAFEEIELFGKSCNGIYSVNYFQFMKEHHLC
jgi:hypothetical protein